MTVRELASELNFETLNEAEGDRDISGGYTGDLLSWVMGRAKADNVWVTIMSNLNVIAVATLAEVSAVVFAEGVRPAEDVVKTAKQRGVNLYISEMASFELTAEIARLI